MGQVEKIFVVSIVGLVLLILAITVFGPGHQEAQACMVPPAASPSGGLENPLQPAELAQVPAGRETRPAREEEPPATVVESAMEPLAVKPAAEPAPSREQAAPKTEPESLPTTAPKAPAPEPAPAPSYRPKPVVPYVIVKKGETLGEILQRELGSAHKYLDLVLQFNEGMDPDHLRAGQKIWLPPSLPRAAASTRSASSAKKAPALPAPSKAPARTYKVRKGDSLWKIATRFFGKKRVLEGIRKIKRANADKDLDLLPAGLVLTIPR